ncbi:MAG: hypothetical protein WCL02_09275 [bacterium]
MTGLLAVAGALTAGLTTTGFLTIPFLVTASVTTFTGVATIVLVVFLPRYFESSNARIGIKIIFKKMIPSPYVQCFQNFFVILNTFISIKIKNTGGIKIHKTFRPDRPPSLNIRYRL